MSFLKNIFSLPFSLVENYKIKKYINSISITNIDSLNGYDFEEYVSALLKICGFKCDTTPRSKDNGVDIIAKKNNIRIAIQTKLYYNHKVSNSAIQEVYTGCIYHKCNIPIVITNSYFSKPAIAIANELNVVLLDRNVLEKITKSDIKDKKYIIETLIYNYVYNLENSKK